MLERITAVIFRKSLDGIFVQNDEWPEYVSISQELIDAADPRYLVVGEGVVEMHAANGSATYRVLVTGEVWECELIEGSKLGPRC